MKLLVFSHDSLTMIVNLLHSNLRNNKFLLISALGFVNADGSF